MLPTGNLLKALAALLKDDPTGPEISLEDRQLLAAKGAVATLEEAAGENVSVQIDAVELIFQVASEHREASVRVQAFHSLERLALAGSEAAVDALYRLAVEQMHLAARQTIVSRGWKPSNAGLQAMFEWFADREHGAGYPEENLPTLTLAFLTQASPNLQHRVLATAARNRAENWARIVSAIQAATEPGFTDLIESYAQLRPVERGILVNELKRLCSEAPGSDSCAKARSTLSAIFIRHEDQMAKDIVLGSGYYPDEAEQRALFFFLAEAWKQYEALDFNHNLLISAYEHAGKPLRRRMLEHSRHTGQMDWLRGLGGSSEVRLLSDLTDADWDLSIQKLVESDRPVELWRLAQVAPPIWSALILTRLAKRGWEPAGGDERTGFTLLSTLAADSLANPLEIRPKKALHAPTFEITSLAMQPGGRLMAAGTGDQRIFQWRLPEGDLLETPLITPAPVTRAIAYSPDGEYLACAAGDNRIRIFQVLDGHLLKTFEGHRAMIRALAIHPDGRTAYSASFDGSIRFWRFPYGIELKTLRPGPGEIFSMVLGGNGGHLISAGADSLVNVWTLPGGTKSRELIGHTATVAHLAASPTSELVASAARDNTIRLWNFTSGGLLRTIIHPGALTALSMHPNDQVLAGGTSTGEITLWNLSTGLVMAHLASHPQAVTGLVFSPGGDRLYSADSAGNLNAWDLQTFLDIRLDGAVAGAGAARLQERLRNPHLATSEKKWLAFSAELARWRQRFDIELGEMNAIQVGEFDIELT